MICDDSGERVECCHDNSLAEIAPGPRAPNKLYFMQVLLQFIATV